MEIEEFLACLNMMGFECKREDDGPEYLSPRWHIKGEITVFFVVDGFEGQPVSDNDEVVNVWRHNDNGDPPNIYEFDEYFINDYAGALLFIREKLYGK